MLEMSFVLKKEKLFPQARKKGKSQKGEEKEKENPGNNVFKTFFFFKNWKTLVFMRTVPP